MVLGARAGYGLHDFNAAQYFAMVLFAPLMGLIVADFGWRWNFVFVEPVDLAAAVAWKYVFHGPRDHPRVGEAELAMIAAGGALVDVQAGAGQAKPDGDLKRKLVILLRMPTLWGVYLGQFFITPPTYFFNIWFRRRQCHSAVVPNGEE